MEEFLTLEDVLREASRVGLELSERTFRYYSVLGLLPRPVKRPSGDARVHYYPADILTRLQDIRSLQNQGYSLKQIKGYFAVVPPARPEGPPQVPPAEGAPAKALLEAFARDLPRQAAERFLARARQPDEAAFRDAAVAYYAELLGMLGDEAAARTAVADAFAELTPMQVDRLLQPLREWRDRQAGRSRAGGLPLARRLRELALRQLTQGEAPDRAELRGYARALQGLAGRALECVDHPDPVVGKSARKLARELERLADSCQAREPALALAEVEQAEKALAEIDQLVRLYRNL